MCCVWRDFWTLQRMSSDHANYGSNAPEVATFNNYIRLHFSARLRNCRWLVLRSWCEKPCEKYRDGLPADDSRLDSSAFRKRFGDETGLDFAVGHGVLCGGAENAQKTFAFKLLRAMHEPRKYFSEGIVCHDSRRPYSATHRFTSEKRLTPRSDNENVTTYIPLSTAWFIFRVYAVVKCARGGNETAAYCHCWLDESQASTSFDDKVSRKNSRHAASFTRHTTTRSIFIDNDSSPARFVEFYWVPINIEWKTIAFGWRMRKDNERKVRELFVLKKIWTLASGDWMCLILFLQCQKIFFNVSSMKNFRRASYQRMDGHTAVQNIHINID